MKCEPLNSVVKGLIDQAKIWTADFNSPTDRMQL